MGESTKRFRDAAKSYVRVQLDTNNLGKELVRQLALTRRTGYLLVLDAEGREVARMRRIEPDRCRKSAPAPASNVHWAHAAALLERSLKIRPEAVTGEALMARLAKSDDPAVRGEALLLQAAAAPTSEGVRFLIEALRVPAVRARAVQELTRLGPKAATALPWLIGRLSDPLASDRANVAYAIAALDPGGEKAVAVFRKVMTQLGPDETPVALGIVNGLSRLVGRSDAARELLGELAKSENMHVRVAAARLLRSRRAKGNGGTRVTRN